MIEITPEVLTAGLKALVSEAGESFVYSLERTSCVYVHDGEPDCIVGQFLAGLGIPIERLERADNPGTMAFDLISQLQDEGYIHASEEVRFALHIAQCRQDTGSTWGESVEIALGALKQ